MLSVKRAIISVSDKNGIVDFAKELAALGVEIISTGGTYRLLKENGIGVKEVSEITGFPEMLDGRVKTLHPKIHAGILARRDLADHMSAIREKGIEPIDMVVINLYPFKQTVLKDPNDIENIVENIDIGGPSMIRAAAKNYQSVAVVTSPDQYTPILEQMKSGGIQDDLLKRLMAEAFITTANYDSMIALQMQARFSSGFPASFPVPTEKVMDLRYGENPNQKAAFYRDPFTPGPTVAKMEYLHGKELSYNNILDMDKALDICMDFEKPTAVVMKHTNPCGLASADTIYEAFVTAYAVDPLSAFGCVICLNRKCDLATAQEIHKYFVEVVVAPDYDKEAYELLIENKKNIRIMKTNCPIGPSERVREFKMKKVQGGLLVQTDEDVPVSRDTLKVITKRAPTDTEIDAMLFAWKLAKHVTSNCVVYVKGERAVGIGAGQMSRVDSAKIATMKANEPTQGCVMASDAFFPFRDGVDEAAKAGVTAIIQPGGSIRDQEVIDAANEHNMAMVFTGCRVFRH